MLDIDDTSLSLYECAKARNFQASVVCSVTEATLPVIRQTKSLYKLAKRRGVAVFFITGRPEGLRPITVSQLEAGGYRGYRALYLRPADDHASSLVPYKSSTRKEITQVRLPDPGERRGPAERPERRLRPPRVQAAEPDVLHALEGMVRCWPDTVGLRSS